MVAWRIVSKDASTLAKVLNTVRVLYDAPDITPHVSDIEAHSGSLSAVPDIYIDFYLAAPSFVPTKVGQRGPQTPRESLRPNVMQYQRRAGVRATSSYL